MTELGQQLISIVRRKAAENPDFVYEPPKDGEFDGTCLYVHNGEPSCLIGQALWEAGLIDGTFPGQTIEGRTWSANTETFGYVANYLQLDISPLESNWLRKAQQVQDHKEPWGKAVAAADRIWPLES